MHNNKIYTEDQNDTKMIVLDNDNYSDNMIGLIIHN